MGRRLHPSPEHLAIIRAKLKDWDWCIKDRIVIGRFQHSRITLVHTEDIQAWFWRFCFYLNEKHVTPVIDALVIGDLEKAIDSGCAKAKALLTNTEALQKLAGASQ